MNNAEEEKIYQKIDETYQQWREACQQANSLIDPDTAEFMYSCEDGIYHERLWGTLPDELCFVRSAGNSIWVPFNDLPEETRDALEKKRHQQIARKSAFYSVPGGHGVILAEADPGAIPDWPVPSIAANDCVLFLRAPTWPQGFNILNMMAFYGLDFVHRSNFVLATPCTCSDRCSGYRHEHLLVAVRGDAQAPAPGAQWGPVFEGPAGGSEMPSLVYGLIEASFPDTRKIYLNARHARPGWTRWDAESDRWELAT
jgi:N6-adenosine-specific RNA methylase IME4